MSQTPAAPVDTLHQQCVAGVQALEAGLGRPFDDASARLAAALAVLAHDHGLSQVDHVLLSQRNGQVAEGEYAFVVQGALGDPAQLRAHMRTSDALALPLDRALARLDALQQAHALAGHQIPLPDDPTPRR